MSTRHTITFEIDTAGLGRVTDAHLAALWHIAQHNPAPHGDRDAGELAGSIGFEIIRRWLAKAPPELYHHQARDHYWKELSGLGKWRDGQFVPGGVRVDGKVISPAEREDARVGAVKALVEAWDNGEIRVGPKGDVLLRNLARTYETGQETTP